MDVLNNILSEIPENYRMCHALTEAYAALFEDVASMATHKTKRVIRELFPQLASRWDDIAVDDAGNPVLTMSGKQQTYIDYFERTIRNMFFHDGANQKFEPGVTRIAYGELKLENRGQDSRKLASLKKIVKLISDGHAGEYDGDLNGMTYDELETRFGTAVQKVDDELKAKLSSADYQASDYVIKEIPDYRSATKFFKYTNPDSPWCITHMENMWRSYTADGMNRVYFAYRPNFRRLKPVKGPDAPLDSYGLSLISIIVDPWGTLRAVTTRWNHANGGSDQAMDATQLSNVLGGNVFELCPPMAMPERHVERIDNDSIRIGDQIWMSHNLQMRTNRKRGIVHVGDETYFAWNAAMEVAAAYGNGWRLPTMDDWDKLIETCGGYKRAGLNLKSTEGWIQDTDDENGNGFDTYGFDAKAAGKYSLRYGRSGVGCKRHFAFFWTSDRDDYNFNWARYVELGYNYTGASTNIGEIRGSDMEGLSVRLVRDA